MNEPQRVRFALAAFVGAAAVALAGPMLAHASPAHGAAAAKRAPGTWCGGTEWRLMTLSDSQRSKVAWTPTATTIADIARLKSPARNPTTRSTSFQRHVWQLTAVVSRFRVASNGEIVLVLYDIHTSTYMNAYLPNPDCLGGQTRERAAILAARKTITSECQKVTPTWQFVGATVQLAGVGYWNPVRSTKGALPNGAELRPVVSFTPLQGCGHF
jgi:hypothetical protein